MLTRAKGLSPRLYTARRMESLVVSLHEYARNTSPRNIYLQFCYFPDDFPHYDGGPGGGVARAPPPAPGDPPRPAALLGLPYTPLVQSPPKILKQPHRPAPVRPVHAAHSLPALHTHTTHLSAPCGSDPAPSWPTLPILHRLRSSGSHARTHARRGRCPRSANQCPPLYTQGATLN